MSDIISIDTQDIIPKEETDKRCAPGLRFEGGSCIELRILVEMTKAFNLNADDSKIKLYDNIEVLNPNKYKKYLISEFGKRMGDKCTTQKCWTEQAFIKNMKRVEKDELEKYTFRPDGPTGRFEWLNTININDVMEQYEKQYPEFKFLGAVPIDFDEFERFGIKNLNYNKLIKEGRHKLGVIFNLDEHDQPGSHWVALYSDLKSGNVLFFDSYATQPEKRIRALMRKLAKFSQSGLGIKDVNIDYNKQRHQYENSECGVYSRNFITRLLKGDSFNSICEAKVPDKKINKCRKKYFGNKITGL